MRIHHAVKTWVVLLSALMSCCANVAFADRIADITNTKHNFSALGATLGTGPNNLPTGQTRVEHATTEPQICVFCHTPHAANTAQTPLWNRQLSNANYTTYSSTTIDASNASNGTLPPPDGISKLCLSCHDGTMAIGAVNVLNGSYTASHNTGNAQQADITMTGSSNGRVPPGEGTSSGFTRYLGTDLTNDHPISVLFDSNLISKDGEMRNIAFNSQTSAVQVRDGSTHPSVDTIVLQPKAGDVKGAPHDGGLVQCNSCHDPHIRDPNNENIKFLRLNRLQKASPTNDSATFNKAQDIICLACHQKAGWAGSAHANNLVGNTTYTQAAAEVREFKYGTQVWETACLACHDTHTVQGARRLIREGTDGTLTASTTTTTGTILIQKSGGKPALEEGCYACHSGGNENRNTLVNQNNNNFQVPNVYFDFHDNRHMPITTFDQANGANQEEVHSIGTMNSGTQTGFTSGDPVGANFIESRNNLGLNNLNNRHAECTDCHNPHRVIKNRHFYDNPQTPDAAGTHLHDDGSNIHNNIASGVLRGIWGVEPIYNNGTAFMQSPSDFSIKYGNPPSGGGTSTAVTSKYLTREYQLCFKCHSNYAFQDNNRPLLGSFNGGTPPGTNQLQRYTNVAMEYQSPNSHQGEFVTGSPSTPTGASTTTSATNDFVTHNHRSWHPVMNNTGRTPSVRNANANNWYSPWNRGVGVQTMYCTDCHGSNTVSTTSTGTVSPPGNADPQTNAPGSEDGNVWGPHGSTNNFILKGPWSGDRLTGTGEGQPTHLCFKCHEYNQYGNPASPNIQNSGFSLGANNMCMMGGGGGGGGMGGGGMGGAGGGGGVMCMAMPAGMGNGMMGGMNNLHIFHANAVNNFRCNLCHVAVPHGWKNKNFLVNLNDTGPEIGNSPGTQVRNNTTSGFLQGPYYNRAVLKIRFFSSSGAWNDDNCGSDGAPGNGVFGVNWMAASSEACVDVP